MKVTFLFLACVVLLGLSSGGQADELKKHFYKKLCPQAEDMVQDLVWASVKNNSTLPAKLLRLFFHDCFVRVSARTHDIDIDIQYIGSWLIVMHIHMYTYIALLTDN